MSFTKVFLSNKQNIAHYVDDYRFEDHVIILCKRQSTMMPSFIASCDDDTVEICKTCIKVSERYPTKENFFRYHSCTDCGADTWSTHQCSYKVVNSVWKIAYPDYVNEEM